MPNNIALSTDTPAQMANLVMLLAGAQSLPARPKPSFAINDSSGHVEVIFNLLTEHQFPVVFLQYLLTIPEPLRDATIKANSENIDRLSGGALDPIKELLGLERTPPTDTSKIDEETRDSSGTLFDPLLHSVQKSDGSPVFLKNGTFRARRGTKTNTVTDTVPDNGQEQPDEVPPEEKQKLYVVRDANGEKVVGGTVSTAREFATGLINYLSNNFDAAAHKAIKLANNMDLIRLLAEDRNDLFEEVSAASIDEV